MPNLYNNTGFEPEEDVEDEENVPDFDLNSANEDDTEESFAKTDENFDLDDDEDADVSAPVFNSSLASSEDDEELEEELEAEEEAELDLEDEAEDEEVQETAFVSESENENDDEEYIEEAEEKEEDCVMIPRARIALARQLIENIRENSARLSVLCGGLLVDGDEERIAISQINDGLIDAEEKGGKIVEGIFNGENMIGPDGKEYSVPANYASKSKLVEGDILKLTITDRGTFIYKQTKPVERRRIIGRLEKDANGNYLVSGEHKKFRVITASITYYKGVPGDKVVILVPVAGDSAWAAVENVIKSK